MTNKEQYSAWIKTQHKLPIFMQPWWLDAVCAGKEWDVVLVQKLKIKNYELSEECVQKSESGSQLSAGNSQVDVTLTSGSAPDEHPMSTRSASDEHPMEVAEKEGKTIIAAMPYLKRKKWWMTWIAMPQMTQIGGIWLDENKEFSTEELVFVCDELSRQLQAMKLHYYYQQYPVGSPCPERMKALGFKVKERVTYRIDDLSDLDKVIDRFSKNKKRQLQKSLSLHAESGMTAEEFYAFHQQALAGKKKEISYSREFLLVLEQKARRAKQSHIMTICNADKMVYAAAMLVWDEQRMYYLLPAIHPDYQESGAGSLLVLEAIKFAREKGVSFDFEGSMIRGVAQHYKQFGSTPYKYYSVEKYYHWTFFFALAWNWLTTRKYN